MNKLLTNFQKYLEDQDLSPLTVKGYLADLQHFARWFEQTNGEALTVQRITPSERDLELAVEHLTK